MDRNIEVYDKKCIACGDCFNVCPTGAIELDGPNPIKLRIIVFIVENVLNNVNLMQLAHMMIISIVKTRIYIMQGLIYIIKDWVTFHFQMKMSGMCNLC